jgi:hypothetical protein
VKNAGPDARATPGWRDKKPSIAPLCRDSLSFPCLDALSGPSSGFWTRHLVGHGAWAGAHRRERWVPPASVESWCDCDHDAPAINAIGRLCDAILQCRKDQQPLLTRNFDSIDHADSCPQPAIPSQTACSTDIFVPDLRPRPQMACYLDGVVIGPALASSSQHPHAHAHSAATHSWEARSRDIRAQNNARERSRHETFRQAGTESLGLRLLQPATSNAFPRKRKRGIIYSRLGAIDFFSLLPTHRPFEATLSDTDDKKKSFDSTTTNQPRLPPCLGTNH